LGAYRPQDYRGWAERLQRALRPWLGNPGASDLKTYDAGTFQLCTQGQADASIIGELWVRYTVELITPKINAVAGQNLLGVHIIGGGAFNSSNPLGSSPSIVEGSNISVVVTGNTVFFNGAGRYMFVYSVAGTGLSGPSFTGSATTVLVSTVVAGLSGASATTAAVVQIFDVLNGTASLSITAPDSTITGAQLFIQQISSALTTVRKPKPRYLTAQKETPAEQRIADLEALVMRLVQAQAAPPPLPSTTGTIAGLSYITGN